jgi:hypothetical protein
MIVDHRHLTKNSPAPSLVRTVGCTAPYDLDLSGGDDETSSGRIAFADDDHGLIGTDASGFTEMLAIFLVECCEQRGLGQ